MLHYKEAGKRRDTSYGVGAMVLYIKRGCPWCVAAESWLQNHNVPYQAIDVLSDPSSFSEMRKISGQSKAPVLVTKEGHVLADFGPEELPHFLKR